MAEQDLERLIGCWRLLSFQVDYDDGSRDYPLGQDADGLIVYTREGYMTGQMMQRGRPRFAIPRKSAAEKHAGTAEEIAAAFNGYFAYFCRFEVSPSEQLVRHHVLCGLLPDWEGQTQVRHYAFDDHAMTLRGPRMIINGKQAQNLLRWRREPAIY